MLRRWFDSWRRPIKMQREYINWATPYLNTLPSVRSQLISPETVSQNWWSMLGRSSVQANNSQLAAQYAAGVIAYACMHRRATILSGLPLKVVLRDEPQRISPAQQFLNNASEFLYLIATSWHLYGCFYLRKHYNQYGYPTALSWVNPLDIQPVVRPNGTKELLYYRDYSLQRNIQPQYIIGRWAFDPWNSYNGVSSFEVAMTNIRLERGIKEYGAAFFLNNALAAGFLVIDDANDDQVATMTERYNAAHKGARNAHRIEITNRPVNFVKVTPDPIDLAMRETLDAAGRDTCIAMETNPVLIGLGVAADPLSAQGTYEAILDGHIRHVELPFLRLLGQALTTQWLSTDFGDNQYVIMPDEEKILIDILDSQERSLTAETNIRSGVFSINDGRQFVGRPVLEGIIDRDPMWAIAAFQGGGLMHGEFRKALGQEPIPGMKTKMVWDVDPRVQPPPALPTLGGNDIPPNSPLPILPTTTVQPPENNPIEEREEQQECYVLLDLSNDPDLVALQNHLRHSEEYQQEGIEWTPSDELHITLIAAPTLDPDTLLLLKSALAEVELPPLDLRIGSLDFFDNLGQYAVHLRIRRNAALLALQAQLVDICDELGIALSAYSNPARWKPHITLCYTRQRPKRITYRSPLTVKPKGMLLSHDNGEGEYQIENTGLVPPITRSQENIAAQVGELNAWKKHIKNWHHDQLVSFAPVFLEQGISDWVRQQLDEHWYYGEVLDTAKRALQENAPLEIGATQEEANEYWRHFDELQADLGRDWLEEQRALAQEVYAISETAELTDKQWDEIFIKHRDILLQRWIGDKEPGTLAALALAGAVAGENLLQQKTQRANVKVNVNWKQASLEAVNAAYTHALQNIKGMDNTTRDLVRKALADSTQAGETKEQLASRLRVILPPSGSSDSLKKRADLIAHTESANVYIQGSYERWKAAGIKQYRWETVRDDRVCKICRSRHGKIYNISDGELTVHGGCRCFRRPIVPSNDIPSMEEPNISFVPQQSSTAFSSSEIAFNRYSSKLEEEFTTAVLGAFDNIQNITDLTRLTGGISAIFDLSLEKSREGVWDVIIDTSDVGDVGYSRRITLDTVNKTISIHNEYITLPKELQGSGIGTKIFAQQVLAAQSLGINEISTSAAGDKTSRLSGYYTWPRIGYDGKIPWGDISQEAKDVLPAQFKNAKMLSEVMETPEGRAWWKEYGTGAEVVFDTTPGSYSMRTLENRLSELGMSLKDLDTNTPILDLSNQSGVRITELGKLPKDKKK